MDRSSLKAHARKQIEGKVFSVLAINIIIYAVSSFIGLILGPFAFLMSLVIAGPIEFAMAAIYLGITNESRTPQVNDIVAGFRGNNFTRSFIGFLRYYIFTFLWSLLFVIPGIIKSISYSQMFYLMAEDEDLDPAQAQKESMKMMEGHKAEFFVLVLSFILWGILGVLTLGIAYIWIDPYINTTMAEYHVRLKKGTKKSSNKDEKREKSDFDEAVEDMKKAVNKAGQAVKKSASEAVANAAESMEKSAKEIKKEAQKAAKKAGQQ